MAHYCEVHGCKNRLIFIRKPGKVDSQQTYTSATSNMSVRKVIAIWEDICCAKLSTDRVSVEPLSKLVTVRQCCMK